MAVQWERLGYEELVARYVLLVLAAEDGNLDSSKEARQMEDRLGLTPMSLLRLRWEVVEAPTDADESRSAGTGAPSRGDPRLRLVRDNDRAG